MRRSSPKRSASRRAGWLALTIDSTTKNELGYRLLHTSPVYVEVAGKKVFDVAAGEAMLKQIEVGHAAIQKTGQFSNAKAGQELLAVL